MKLFWRIVSMVVVGLMALVIDPFEINWDGVRWGTAPEWISALALVAITAGVWRIAVLYGREKQPTRGERISRF